VHNNVGLRRASVQNSLPLNACEPLKPLGSRTEWSSQDLVVSRADNSP
jgi:hypothetical protein